MPGGVIFVFAMVLVVPVAVMFAGALWSALFGWLEVADADAEDADGASVSR